MHLTIEIPPAQLRDVLPSERELAQAAGEGVRDCIRRHLTDRNMHTEPNRHGLPHSNYWHKAANTVKVEPQGGSRTIVSVGTESDDPNEPGQGVALHYFGGVVYPSGGRKALAIPISTEVAGKNPREVNKLTDGIALVWPKNSSHGFLKDEGTSELLWLLIPKATIKADPTVLPTEDEMRDAGIAYMEGVMAS